MFKKILYIVLFIALAFGIFLYINQSNKKEVDTLRERDVQKVSKISEEKREFHIEKSNNKALTLKPKNKIKSDNIYITRLKKILAMERIDILQLDKIMSDLLTSDISRKDKIEGIWDILNEIGFTSEKSQYLLDSLATLLPIELTDELIDVYNNLDNSNIKIKIIDILAKNIDIANPNLEEDKLKFIIKKIGNIESFLEKNILVEQDKSILINALTAYSNIADSEDTQELISQIKEREDIDLFKEEEFLTILTQTAISTEEAQEEMLPTIIEKMSDPTINPKERESFNQIILDTINANALSESSKRELAPYLKAQEPKLETDKRVSTDTISKYYLWAEANSKIEENSINLEKIVMESQNPIKISSILLYADEKDIQKIKKNQNIGEVYSRLKLALAESKINDENKIIIKDAISILKPSLKE